MIADKILNRYDKFIAKEIIILKSYELCLVRGLSKTPYMTENKYSILENLLNRNSYLHDLEQSDDSLEEDVIRGHLSLVKNRFNIEILNVNMRHLVKLIPNRRNLKKSREEVYSFSAEPRTLDYILLEIMTGNLSYDDECIDTIKSIFKDYIIKEMKKIGWHSNLRKANKIKNSKSLRKMEYPVVDEIELFFHQKRAIQIGLVVNEYNYYMEQRTGKTLVNACIAAIRFQRKQVKEVLVICPKNAIEVWRHTFENEITIDVIVLVLGKKYSEPIVSDNYLMIYIVNFESVNKYLGIIQLWNPDMCIVDEGHRLQSWKTGQSKALHKLSDITIKFNNTGTPIEKHLEDMYSQYRFLIPHLLGYSYTEFKDKYLIMGQKTFKNPWGDKKIIGYRHKNKLLKMIHDTSYRVLYEECFKDSLKIETISEYGKLSSKNRKIYHEMDKELVTKVGDKEIEASIVLSKMIKLQQITGGFINDENKIPHTLGDEKLKLLYESMKKHNFIYGKAIIFVRFSWEMWAIEDYLYGLGYKTLTLSGKDKNGKKLKRQQKEFVRKLFQTSDMYDTMIAQIKSVKEAIDLSAADVEYFYSTTFSFKEYDQAKKRIINPKKTRPIRCVNLIMEDTIDEVLEETIRNKGDLTFNIFDKHRNIIRR